MEPEEFMSLIDDAVHNGPSAIAKIKTLVQQIRGEIEAYENQENEVPAPEDLTHGEDHSDEIAQLMRQNQDDLLGTNQPAQENPNTEEDLNNMEIDEFNNELQIALDDENYERAGVIRDVINNKLNK